VGEFAHPGDPALGHTGVMHLPSRTLRRSNVLLAAAAMLALVLAPAASAQDAPAPPAPVVGEQCAVVVTATVAAPSVPGGSWSTGETCVAPETVYETEVLGYRLIGGLAVATYTDGHEGRIAFLSAKVGADRSLSLVGVEDAATGAVTWSYADGSYVEGAGVRTAGGAGEAVTVAAAGEEPGPVEASSAELSIAGSGTDLATAQGPVPDQLRAWLDQAVAALTA
jgi:hypothetical protein